MFYLQIVLNLYVDIYIYSTYSRIYIYTYLNNLFHASVCDQHFKMVRDVSSCVDDAISVTEIENSESWTESWKRLHP